MPRLTLSPAPTGPAAKSGISLGLSETKGGLIVRLGLTAAAQAECFGRALRPGKEALDVILHDDQGATHLMALRLTSLAAAGGLPLTGGMRGSVAVKILPWTQMGEGKRPAVSLPIVNRIKGEGDDPAQVTVKLPEWARPPARAKR